MKQIQNNPTLQIIVFTLAVYLLTYSIGQWVFVTYEQHPIADWIRQHWILALMWLPGLTSIICRIVFWQGLHDVGWHIPSRRHLTLSLLPFAAVTTANCLALITQQATLSPTIYDAPLWQNTHDWFTVTHLPLDNLIPVRILWRFLLIFTLGMIPHFIFAFGEELGWRGYLQTRLTQTYPRYSLWIAGIIWSQWHFPFLLINPQQPLWDNVLWVVQFTLVITLLGVLIGWLRLLSNSILPATIAHATHNATLSFFVLNFQEQQTGVWVSETGWLTIVTYAGIIIWLYRSGHIHNTLQNFTMNQNDDLQAVELKKGEIP